MFDLQVKFDGVEILNTTTTSSSMAITFPSGYDRTQTHVLDVDYTVYAVDDNGQVLEQKNHSIFLYSIKDFMIHFKNRLKEEILQ